MTSDVSWASDLAVMSIPLIPTPEHDISQLAIYQLENSQVETGYANNNYMLAIYNSCMTDYANNNFNLQS